MRRKNFQQFAIAATTIIVVFFTWGVQAVEAATVNYYVRADGNDSNDGSANDSGNAWLTIQNAIDTVANPTTDTIIINISGDTYDLNNTSLSIDRDFTDLTLQGDTAATTIIQAHNDPASSTARVISIGVNENVTIDSLTIEHGRSDTGSGLYINNGGQLTLSNCAIDDNDASSSNSAGVFVRSDTYVTNCTFSNNNGGYSGAFMIDYSGTKAELVNNTFFNNTSTYGQVAVGYISTLVMVNNTITKGGTGVAIVNGAYAGLYLKNNLIAGLDSGYSLDAWFNGTTKIYAENNVIVNERNNKIEDGVDGNQEGAGLTFDLATSLADNDRTDGVQTVSIGATSVAIDAGDSAAFGPEGDTVTPPLADQRDAARVGTIDVGSYEYDGVPGAPYITTVSPADDATDVSATANLVLTFSEAVDAETGNITLYESDDTEVEVFDVTSDISGSGTDTITINPTADFDSATSYYVQIDATAFDDVDSNSFTGISDETSWTFTAADIENPVVSTLSPADNATSVAVDADLVITFDEAVDAESGDITLYKYDGTEIEVFDVTSDISGTGTTTITIDPTDDLQELTGYYLQVDATAFDDSASNSYAGISNATTWNFTTTGTASISVNPSTLTVIEGSLSDGIYLGIATEPTDDVVVTFSYTATDVSLSADSVTFTSANWESGQSTIVTAIDDDIDRSDRNSTISMSVTSGDVNYDGLSLISRTVSLTEDDDAGITVSQPQLVLTEGDVVDTLGFVLTSQPTANVTFTLSSANSEVNFSSSTLTFTSANWDTQQTITVTAVDDEDVEGTHSDTVSIDVVSSDTTYDAFTVSDRPVTITDNDTASEDGDDSDSNDNNSDNIDDSDDSSDSGNTDEEEFTSPIQRIKKKKGRVRVHYNDGTTGAITPFKGKKNFRPKLVKRNDAVIATNGKVVRLFIDGTQVAQKKVNNKKHKKKKYRIKTKKLYTKKNYTNIVFLSTNKKTAKLVVMRLNAKNKLKKKSQKVFRIQNSKKIQVKFKKKKKRIIAIVGKGEKRTKRAWKLTKKGKVKAVKNSLR